MLFPFLDINGYIALAFFKLYLVACRYLVANPFSDVLSSSVEREDFVEILMVEFVNYLLDVYEVFNHPIVVKLLGSAPNGDFGIMAVKTLTLAGVGQGEIVCVRYFEGLADVIHADYI